MTINIGDVFSDPDNKFCFTILKQIDHVRYVIMLNHTYSNGTIYNKGHTWEAGLEWLTKCHKQSNGGVMKEVMADVSGFMKAHRGVIYTVVLVLVLDQLVFKGAFRERVKSLVSGLLDKAEASVKKV